LQGVSNGVSLFFVGCHSSASFGWLSASEPFFSLRFCGLKIFDAHSRSFRIDEGERLR
jgi:hypothetical protein